MTAIKHFIVFCCFTLPFISVSQNKHTINGTISDNNSNETLIGVTIAIPELKTGATTNEYGFYSLTLPEGTYSIVISYLGYKEVKKSVDLKNDIKIDFQLEEEAEQLSEIIVTENVEKTNIRTPQMSVNSLSTSTIKKIPVVLGEADVLKAIVLLPGVSNAGEGSSGFNVRGGSADQNLILLDEATIFNSSHLFGFFSVFNPDAIKDIKLFKGGIPSRYGGRVSSVLEIFQKEGNSKKFEANGGIGLVASRLLLEGPIVKDKAAFLIGGRSSYAHLFLPLFDIENKAYFYDLNTKLNFKLNDKNSFFLSGYFGRDVFSLKDSFVNTYGNSVGNLRWNHLFSDKLFSNLSLIYSDYYYGLKLDFVGFNWNSGIQNFNLKYDLKHYLNSNLQINYGINNIYYQFNPGKISPSRDDSGIIEDQLAKKYANEFAAYIDIEHDITKNLSLEYGLRFSTFNRLGQDDLFEYLNDSPVIFNPLLQIYQEALPIGIKDVSRRKSLTTYTNFEPRFAASYAINDNTSLKASYTRLTQYLHLLSNTSSPTPLDVWTPSGPYIKPQKLDQYAFGYFKSINDDVFSLESEVFYKNVKNRIDYIDGANLIANNAIERIILNGKARAYGLEFLFRKNQGKFQGWFSYTLSKSEQRTEGRDLPIYEGTAVVETGINNGEWYNTPYDKTHDFSIFGSYELNQKWNINANFAFQTGQPTNYPIGQFEFQGLNVPYYGLRNTERLPNYHRLDISATLTPKKNSSRRLKSEWVFSIYNVYNQKNAASITFRQNNETNMNEANRISIFGIVPSVTYNFKF
ncbi:TonB-dependent receptor [Cellulophaga sp. HaHaR_3_176]|uniref:TonB-dependent receptor n=1 Tax=Cellulophaga sp. HaHaR_3_176 TaxID=1942464 RepID=UPI001C1F9E63|nr:TonB-dependent receptor [Cellulophaga sp. HaHaR_3_176]QWX82582.1 TonB-dependent receptor [Cellulophaga sp. HaHaR_3_176]